ncbi:hypothetical protein E2C01_061543 [Portunus trituberculatus]|uniref:Uncharacterized protein n=1 Tax=Portunus trituberculatus TaxID=210409 RepID=A0A5B7HDH1_PORTR|nr:hypothetical protein [Portunus trituberculatus]
MLVVPGSAHRNNAADEMRWHSSDLYMTVPCTNHWTSTAEEMRLHLCLFVFPASQNGRQEHILRSAGGPTCKVTAPTGLTSTTSTITTTTTSTTTFTAAPVSAANTTISASNHRHPATVINYQTSITAPLMLAPPPNRHHL